jgi:hypothetical protein
MRRRILVPAGDSHRVGQDVGAARIPGVSPPDHGEPTHVTVPRPNPPPMPSRGQHSPDAGSQ